MRLLALAAGRFGHIHAHLPPAGELPVELLERERDLAVLADALDQAAGGCGRIALVSGEAGIGKTSFVEGFIATHAQGVCVLKGNCDPLFTPTPLGPLYDIARQTNARLLAELENGPKRAALFSSLLEMLRASRAPTVVVIEDVHWADDATLDLLKFLGRRMARTSALLVLTYREDEVAAQRSLRMLLGDLAASKATLRIELPRLSIEAIRTLVGTRALDPAALHRQTSGNPFFVTEILSSAACGIPPTVRDAVLARAARLSPAGRAVLEAAAVIGSRIDHRLLEQVLDGKVEGLAECTRSGMLETAGPGLAFRHELAREAVLTDLDPARFRELNRRALEASRKTDTRRAELAQLVQYAQGAGDSEAVREFGLAAARAAAAVGAHREAAAQYARILDHAADRPPAERARYCEAYAEECAIVDQLPEAEAARRQAIELWREVGDPLKEGENRAELAWPLVRAGRNAAADETSRQAIEVLEKLPPSRQLANAFRVQAHLRMLDRDCALAVRLGKTAIGLASCFDDDVTIAAAENVIGSALLVSGDDSGLDHLQRSIALAQQTGMDAQVGVGHCNIAASYGEQYRYAEAERHLAEGMAYTAERDLDYANHYMHAWLALTRLHQGRWDEASDIATSIIVRPSVSAISRIVSLVALGRVRARRGDPDADAVLDEALELAAKTETLQRLAPVRAARAEAAWLAGDAARTAVEAGAACDLALKRRHGWYAGELIFLRRLGGECVAAPSWCAPPFLLQMKGQWRRAAAAWEKLGCPYEKARALADGDTAAQIEALEIFTRLGAAPAAALLRQRMRGAGIRHIPRGPRPTTRRNPYGLTVREMEILGCVADGLTNGRIGARLHVSPKTVDHHVSSVLAKLGATSRGEAARIAQERQLLVQHGEIAAAK
jgi:DNA-binding CsgD family transcriptional regulator